MSDTIADKLALIDVKADDLRAWFATTGSRCGRCDKPGEALVLLDAALQHATLLHRALEQIATEAGHPADRADIRWRRQIGNMARVALGLPTRVV